MVEEARGMIGQLSGGGAREGRIYEREKESRVAGCRVESRDAIVVLGR